MKTTASYPTVPRLKTIKSLLKFVRNPIPGLLEYHKEYGDTYYMYLGGVQRGMVTRDPVIIKEVLQKQNRNFEKSDIQVKMVAKYLGKGLLTNKGADWLRQRRLIQPGFHKEKIENLISLMMGVINKYGDKLAKQREGESVDIVDEMVLLPFEIIARTLFSQPLPEEQLNEMCASISAAQEHIIKKIRLPFLKPYFYLSGQEKGTVERIDAIRSQLLELINIRRKSRIKNPGATNDLLDMLLDARYEDNGEPMTDDRLLDEILILFLAGHETTSTAMSWAWYILSQRPEVVDHIRKEAADFFSEPLAMESFRKLEYTSRVIEEIMRIYPPAWMTDRVAVVDTEVQDHLIKKGEVIFPFLYGAHHHPALWKNPEIFNPDRFLPEAKKQRAAAAYLPFGAGPRFCIGNNFAMMEMQLIVAHLCHNFDFERVSPSPIDVRPLVTLKPASAIDMIWRKRHLGR